jgi:hypothetical protein
MVKAKEKNQEQGNRAFHFDEALWFPFSMVQSTARTTAGTLTCGPCPGTPFNRHQSTASGGLWRSYFCQVLISKTLCFLMGSDYYYLCCGSSLKQIRCRPIASTHIHTHARTPSCSLPILSHRAPRSPSPSLLQPPRRMRNGRRRKQPSAPHNLTLALSSARIQTFGHDSRLSVRRSFRSSSQSKPCRAHFSVSHHSTCHPPRSHRLTLLANRHDTRISGCEKALRCGFPEFSLPNLPTSMMMANCRFGYCCCSR